MSFKKILIPVDFSSYSDQAVKTAVDLFPDAKIYLLYVVESKADGILGVEFATKFQHDMREAAYAKLEGIIRGMPVKHADIEPIIDAGKPVNVILNNSKTLDADLVILGSHGSGSLTETFFGNTTYQVSRQVSCSTLIIRI